MTKTIAALMLLAGLTLSGCGGGSDPAPKEEATPAAATPTAPEPATASELGVHDLADVVEEYGLKAVPDDDYYIATLPDGTECDVNEVMTSRSDVQFAMEMGDVVATNADMSIGFLVGGDKQATCLNGLNVMLGYQP